MADRFFFAQDNSFHWYLVRADRRDEWDAWCELDADDERSWVTPDYAQRLNTRPSRVTFENPKTES